jgi:hypothetical protein
MEVLHARCCGIDVHKESLVACLRQQEGRRKHAEIQSSPFCKTVPRCRGAQDDPRR